ncbi:hypothetical protein [Novosphingobium colocasiae]|uniref:hypothetical protein n=1 Tax=Novosphingobium colocasiae TaxID=1256513 RepID=UPI0035B2068C
MTKSATKVTPITPEATTPENALILSDKAEAAKEAVAETTDKVVSFVKAHPVAVIAGGIAAGILVSALLPRRSGRKALGKALKLAEIAGAASMLVGEGAGAAKVLGSGAARGAGTLANKAGRASNSLGTTLGKAGVAALGAAATLGKATAAKAGDVSHSAGSAAERIKDRFVH